jgi:hypothetical protein
VFQTEVVENKTCIEYVITLRDKVDKYGRVGQATNGNVVRAHCMLDTNTYSQYVILMALLLHQWLLNAKLYILSFFDLVVKYLQIIEFL